jgi:hypothetical protein
MRNVTFKQWNLAKKEARQVWRGLLPASTMNPFMQRKHGVKAANKFKKYIEKEWNMEQK